MKQLTNAQQLVLANLRSGRFRQGSGLLRSWGDQYCCLGVICQTFHEDTGQGQWVQSDRGYRFEVGGHGSQTALPPAVYRWLDEVTPNPDLLPSRGAIFFNDTLHADLDTIAFLFECRFRGIPVGEELVEEWQEKLMRDISS